MLTLHSQHRSLPPSAPAQPARGGGADPTALAPGAGGPAGVAVISAPRDVPLRTPDALEVIRQDFDSMVAEIQTLRVQRDEYELKGTLHPAIPSP